MKIVLVSDTHLAPRATVFRKNWDVIARWIEDVRPDLVVHLGDITVDGVSEPGELGAARAVFDLLTVPMRFIPGNHDVGDNPLATGPSGDHPLDLARLTDYRDLFGSDRWTLDAGAWQIVALNAQLSSLRGDLSYFDGLPTGLNFPARPFFMSWRPGRALALSKGRAAELNLPFARAGNRNRFSKRPALCLLRKTAVLRRLELRRMG